MDLRQFLAMVVRRRRVVVASFLAVVAAAAVFTWTSRPVYRATAKILVDTSRRAAVSGQLPLLSDLAGVIQARSVQTQAEILRSPRLQQDALSRLSLGENATLGNPLSVNIQEVRSTDVIVVSASSYSSEVAAAVANAVCEEYIQFNREEKRRQVSAAAQYVLEQLGTVREQLNQTQATLESTASTSAADPDQLTTELRVLQDTYQMLNEQYHSLRISEQSPLTNAQVISPAQVPAFPDRPRKLLNLVLAVVLGLGLAFGLAALVDRLDDRVHSEEDAELASGRPALVTVPLVRDEAVRSLVSETQTTSPLLESYRMLRTNIVLSAVDKPIRSIVITSSEPGEGKTLTATNLAIAMALDGKAVILVDGDLRRPSIHRLFGLSNEVGFTTLIAGLGTLPEVLQETKIPGLKVLTSGPIPPNPPELLNSGAAQACFTQIQEQGDFLVVDSPPALALADTLVLGNMTDAALLVVSPGEAKKHSLARTSDLLAQTGARVLGVVLNKADERPGGYYYRSYKYEPYDEQPSGEGKAKKREESERSAGPNVPQ